MKSYSDDETPDFEDEVEEVEEVEVPWCFPEGDDNDDLVGWD